MKADWVAASVRARAMALRRVGAGAIRRIALEARLGAALPRLAGTVYAERTAQVGSLTEAHRAVAETVLWQLRVLAGWLPASGTRLLRAAAAGFERENILALARQLDGGTPCAPFELGALATAWPQLRGATTRAELATALRRSRWGDVGDAERAELADLLRVSWLRELATAAPAARPWAARASALTVARVVLVDRDAPSPLLRRLVRPLIGDEWPAATDPASLRAALPPSARSVLDGVDRPDQLWRAEARAAAVVEDDSFALLRGALPGPPVVLGAVGVLAVDAWRLCAALAAAEAGGGPSEVLDAVA